MKGAIIRKRIKIRKEKGFMRFRSLIKYCFLFSLICIPSIGCSIIPSHIHNEGNANRATTAQDNWVEYSKKSESVYSTMLSNIEKFKTEEELVLSQLAARHVASVITMLPSMNVGYKDEKNTESLKVETLYFLKAEIDTDIKEFGEKLAEAIALYFLKKTQLKEEEKKAGMQLKSAEEKVKEAKSQVDAWNQTVALFQEAFISVAKSEKLSTKEQGKSKWFDTIKDLADKEIAYTDADGKEKKERIGKILGDSLPSIMQPNKPEDFNKLLDIIPEAPGIALTIMALGLDLAQIEKQRVETQIARLDARKVLFEKALAEMEIAEKLMTEIKTNDSIEKIAGNCPTKDENGNLFLAMSNLYSSATAKDINPELLLVQLNSISASLITARKLAIAKDIISRQIPLLDVSLSRLKHEDSVVYSRLNEASWLALVNRGLEGLVAYHKGGLNEEDTANIIRLAQTVALGVIGARVD